MAGAIAPSSAHGEAPRWPSSQYYSLNDELIDNGSGYGEVKTHVYQDMSRPLSEYFISAAHNSYLEGNQVIGKSGTETIRKSLLLGCRVLELDCWDGASGCRSMFCGSKAGVVCTHGGTLTSKVPFSACCIIIRDFAFVTSQYPVIINLDLHVNDSGAEHMAEVAKEVFGDMLYVESEHAEFPSPQALQGRILLRTAIADAPPLEPLIGVKKIRRKEMEAAMGEPGKVAAMPPVSVSYAEKIMDTMLTRPPTSMGSAELEARLSSFRRMSARHLVRVYPDGIRINSSNFCPWSMWFTGASLATLNWQVWDRDVMTNLGFFRENGACGYVHKPPWTRGIPTAKIKWHTLVAHPFAYRSGESKRKGKVHLKMCVQGTAECVKNPACEALPWTVSALRLKNKRDHRIVGEAHRVKVAAQLGVLTIWVEHKTCDGMVGIPLRSLRPGRWWFPVLNRNGVVRSDQSHNDWIAMDVHLEDVT
eukprot:m.23084 g.23084  ORF g.23084 m.23084 type:complete len:476 (-) comp10905_c0_seq1:90-1517(-)